MQVTLNLKIVDDSGADFYSSNNVWDGMDRASVVMMEKMLVGFLSELTNAGEQLAKEKVAKK